MGTVHTLGGSAFGTCCGGGLVSLYVPSGFDAFPRNASTSPLVNIPRTPVPLILSASVMPFSTSKRRTDGKSGRLCLMSWAEWE